MRTKSRAFLSCAVLAGLLTPGWAIAQIVPPPAVPTSCQAGSYHVTVTGMPSTVSCSNTYSTTSQCTEISYTVSGAYTDFASTDHVSALQGVGVAYVKSGTTGCTSCSIFPVGQGDNLTGLGKAAAHEQAVRINPNDTKSTSFTIGLAGDRKPSATTVLVKKGKAVNSCRILGIGADAAGAPNPFQPLQRTETVKFKGCAVDFSFDAVTGAPVSATLNEFDSAHPRCSGTSGRPCCSDVIETSLDKLNLRLDESVCPPTATTCELGPGAFSTDAYISTGSNSCTTRIIGGRVYSGGDPCPD